MQPLSDRIWGDVEHDRDLGNGEALPRREQEYLSVGATEVGDRVEDDPAGIVVVNRLVGRKGGPVNDRAHSVLEPSMADRASPVVAGHVVGRRTATSAPHRRPAPR
jgi:hypothetical protein